MQVAGQPSETLANQPPGSQANKQPPGPLARQSASQPAIRTPFKHLLLPAMRISLYPSSPSRPPPLLSLSFPCSLSILFPFPFAFSLSLPLCPVVRHLQGVARRTHNFATNPRGGWCKQASNQPAERGGQFGSKQRGSLKHADNEQPARRPAGHTAKLSSGQPARGRPARRPSSQLVCLSASQPASQPARIHRGNSCLSPSAPSLSQPQQVNRSDASLSLSLSLSLFLCVGVRSSSLIFV